MTGADDRSTVFQFNAGGGITTLHRFDQSDGSPNALIQAADGSLYGTMLGPSNLGTDGDFYGVSGVTDAYREWTIFKIDAAGTFTTLYRFDGGGINASVLIQGNDGSFYGTAGGLPPIIFSFDPAGTLTTLYTLSWSVDGALARALIQARDGSLYAPHRPRMDR